MLRITKTSCEGRTALKLEGRVAKPWITELERACRAQESPLVLDLSGVSFADELGTEAIRRLRAEGAELVGLSRFLHELIERRNHDSR